MVTPIFILVAVGGSVSGGGTVGIANLVHTVVDQVHDMVDLLNDGRIGVAACNRRLATGKRGRHLALIVTGQNRAATWKRGVAYTLRQRRQYRLAAGLTRVRHAGSQRRQYRLAAGLSWV